MYFNNEPLLWFLLLIPLLLLLSARSYRRANTWLISFSRQPKPPIPYIITLICLCATLLTLTFSLAKPTIQYEKTYFNRGGIEVVIGIDVSKSMLAEDVSLPADGTQLFSIMNRLNRARYFAIDLLSHLHGERVGIYIFANEGVEIVPFTTDYGYCRYVLRHINDAEITIPGSNLGAAIRSGMAIAESSPTKGLKRIILLSDGEDITADKSSLYDSASQAAEKDIKIYTVGIGMGRNVLIPIRSADGQSILNYYLDEDGSHLKTNLVPETLQNIATITGGRYFRIDRDMDPDLFMEILLQDAQGEEETTSTELAWFDLSPVFLIMGLAFFLIGSIVDQ